MDSNINIDWSSVTVKNWYPSSEYDIDEVIFRAERHPSVRNKDHSYEIERTLLDLVGAKEFVHGSFEIQVHLLSRPIYIRFTATDMKIGMRGHQICR